MSKEHFIKNIEIKNFKCFKDFKAEGFGRVNLIGGKNNVGKTAFMEACFLGVETSSLKFLEHFIILELNRDSLNFLLMWMNNYKKNILKYHKSTVIVNDENKSIEKLYVSYGDNINNTKNIEFEKYLEIYKNKELYIKLLDNFYEKDFPPLINNSKFISVGNNFNSYLVNFIDEIKLADKEDILNKALKSFFDIEKIDIIRNKVMLKKESKYLLLSEFGDGVKHFLNIILALYLNKDSILYLDEIENGIHYTNLDKLWEIILTISKQQNVQVFATTHSKECIESYARVAKKLEDEEIGFIELGRNKKNELDSIVMNSEMFLRFIDIGNEVRGW